MTRVLIVDDDDSLAEIWLDCLREEGFDPYYVCPDSDTLTNLASGRCSMDILITDFSMPGLTGLEVCAVAKQLDCPPRVILVTGFEPDSLPETGCADLVLCKPLSLRLLLDAVRRLAAYVY